MGKNKLGNLMKTALKVSGIVGKKVTNHSVRKTMIQRLVDSNFTPNVIAQLSGHQNLKSLDSYMSASEKTQKEMSLSLSGSGNGPVQKPVSDMRMAPCPSTSAAPISEVMPALAVLSTLR